MSRPSERHIHSSIRTCVVAMKSSKLWAEKPGSYNQLLYSLIVSADNLSKGRADNESPEDTAAWGRVGDGAIEFGFSILQEIAAHSGDAFFLHPEGAAAELQKIVLHFIALDIRRTPEGGVKYSEPSATDHQPRFALFPLWPMVPVEPEQEDGDPPLVMVDGFCGHGRIGDKYKFSNCPLCAESWGKQYRASLEKRRAWEARRDERAVRTQRVKTENERLMDERKRELYGIRVECTRGHTSERKFGDVMVSEDGKRVFTYAGQPGSNPELPWNWALTLPRTKRSDVDPTEVTAWNQDGLPGCPNCSWRPESDEQRRRREARERKELAKT